MGRNKDKYADFMEDHRYEDDSYDNGQNGYDDDYSDNFDPKSRKKNKKQKKRDRNRNQYEDDDYQVPQEKFNQVDESEQYDQQDQYEEQDQYDEQNQYEDPNDDSEQYDNEQYEEDQDEDSPDEKVNSSQINHAQTNSPSAPASVTSRQQNNVTPQAVAGSSSNSGVQPPVRPQIINTFSTGSSFSFRSTPSNTGTPSNTVNVNKNEQNTVQVKQEQVQVKPSVVPQRPVFVEQKSNSSVSPALPNSNNQTSTKSIAQKDVSEDKSTNPSITNKAISNKIPSKKDPVLLSDVEKMKNEDIPHGPSIFSKITQKIKNSFSTLSRKNKEEIEDSEKKTVTKTTLQEKTDQSSSLPNSTDKKLSTEKNFLKENENNKDITKNNNIKDNKYINNNTNILNQEANSEKISDISEGPKLKDRFKNFFNSVCSKFHHKDEEETDSESGKNFDLNTNSKDNSSKNSQEQIKAQKGLQSETSKVSSEKSSEENENDDSAELPRNWSKIRKQTAIITTAITVLLVIGYSSYTLMTEKEDIVSKNLANTDETSAIPDINDPKSLVTPEKKVTDKIPLQTEKETEAPKKSFFSFLKFWEKSDKKPISPTSKKDSSLTLKGSDKNSLQKSPLDEEKDVLLTLKKNEENSDKALASITLPKNKNNKEDIIPLSTPKTEKSLEKNILDSVKSKENNGKPSKVTVTDPLHPDKKINVTLDSEKKSLTVASASPQDPLTSDQIKENLKKDLKSKTSELASQLPKSVDIPLGQDKKATINLDPESAKNANGELDLKQLKPKSVDISNGDNKKATVTFDPANVNNSSNTSALDQLKPKSVEITTGNDKKATLTFVPANPPEHSEGALPVPSAETVKPLVPLPSTTPEVAPLSNNSTLDNNKSDLNNLPLPSLASGNPNSDVTGGKSSVSNVSPSETTPPSAPINTETSNPLSLSSTPQPFSGADDSLSLASPPPQAMSQTTPSTKMTDASLALTPTPTSNTPMTSSTPSGTVIPAPTPISTNIAPFTSATPTPEANATQPALIASTAPAPSANTPIANSDSQSLAPTTNSSQNQVPAVNNTNSSAAPVPPANTPITNSDSQSLAPTTNSSQNQVPAVDNINSSAVPNVQSVPIAMAGTPATNQGATFAPVTPAGNYSLSPFGSYSVPGEVIHTETLNQTRNATIPQNQQPLSNSAVNNNNLSGMSQGTIGNSIGQQNQIQVTNTQNSNIVNGSQTNTGKQVEYREYITMEGDNLLSIAGHELGDSLRWSEIRDLNPEAVSKLSEGSPTFPVGTKLYLPPYDNGNQ